VTPWQRYLALMAQHPELFRNEDGGIRIVSDEGAIIADQAKLDSTHPSVQTHEPHGVGVLVEDAWFWILRDWVEFPSGYRGGYLRVVNRRQYEGGHGVAVLAMRGGDLLLIRQYRHALRGWAWEIPRGFGEPGLSAEENARRELREETGLMPLAIVPLGLLCPDSGAMDERVNLFIATLDREAALPARTGQTDEAIAGSRFVSPRQLEAMIVEGVVTDSFTLAAYTLARARGLLIEDADA
jgi:ADP-ribose pyrophosphatase